MEDFNFVGARLGDRPRSAIHAWLVPSYPDLAVFIPIIVTAILIAGTMRAIMTVGYGVSPGAVAWTAALLEFVHLSVGLLITVVWRWSIPKRLAQSEQLWANLFVSYSPLLGAAIASTWATLWLNELLNSQPQEPVALTAAILILMGLIWLVAGLLASHFTHMRDQRRKYEQQLEVQLEETRRSRRRIVHVQEELRKSVAQRLHGRVQNRLLVAAHWLREANRDASLTSTNDAREKLERALIAIEEVNDRDLRAIIRQLHPSVIQLGLIASLQSLLDRFQGALDVSLSVGERVADLDKQNPRAIPEEVRLTLFRVIEEALNNVVKHAKASQVQLKIGCATPEVISAEVRDDGRGFDPNEAVPGFGILSMRDYCGALGGQLQIESQPGFGTVVRASLSLRLNKQWPHVTERGDADEASQIGATGTFAS